MYQPANLHKKWRQHLEHAGLPTVPFHSLRHTAASFLVALNVHPRLAMEILGHSNIRTTMEVYSHAQKSSMRAVLESVENVLRRDENANS
ncbi:MAG: tyrosine-type recombinase/integrase, partial [Chloroflexia bacterium]|nr:tyrosine-type recombinase/integrase [Chloroflexia bacterium]